MRSGARWRRKILVRNEVFGPIIHFYKVETRHPQSSANALLSTWKIMFLIIISRKTLSSLVMLLPGDMLEMIALYLPLQKALAVQNNKSWKCFGFEYTSHWERAAKLGDLAVIKWLQKSEVYDCDEDARNAALEMGESFDSKKYTEIRLRGCSKVVMGSAIANGHLEVVKWLHVNRREGYEPEAMDFAAYFGHLETLQWLHLNRNEGCTPMAMDLAASAGFLNIVKWLHNNRSEGCTLMAMFWAAEIGHLEMVKWLFENRTEGDLGDAFRISIENGHYELLEYLTTVIAMD